MTLDLRGLVPGSLGRQQRDRWVSSGRRAQTHLRMHSRAWVKTCGAMPCSCCRIRHCSSVTDMAVRSLALLQLVNRTPLRRRQICQQERLHLEGRLYRTEMPSPWTELRGPSWDVVTVHPRPTSPLFCTCSALSHLLDLVLAVIAWAAPTLVILCAYRMHPLSPGPT